jgi:hypothetical protein
MKLQQTGQPNWISLGEGADGPIFVVLLEPTCAARPGVRAATLPGPAASPEGVTSGFACLDPDGLPRAAA